MYEDTFLIYSYITILTCNLAITFSRPGHHKNIVYSVSTLQLVYLSYVECTGTGEASCRNCNGFIMLVSMLV